MGRRNLIYKNVKFNLLLGDVYGIIIITTKHSFFYNEGFTPRHKKVKKILEKPLDILML